MGQESGLSGGLSEDLWKSLTGKKIVLAGTETVQRLCFREILTDIAKTLNHTFTVSEEFASAGADDYVLIFAGGEERQMQKTHDGYPVHDVREMNGECRTCKSQGTNGTYAACRAQSQLWDVLAETAQRQPKAALLVSSNLVYGKCFGAQRTRTEHELGYVCHTASADAAAEQFRIAENLAYRLAKETGLHIGIVRVDGSWQDAQMEVGAVQDMKRTAQTAENAGSAEAHTIGNIVNAEIKMIEAAMRALLYGEPGQVYNLPGAEHNPLIQGNNLSGAEYNLPDGEDNLSDEVKNRPNTGHNLSDRGDNLSDEMHNLPGEGNNLTGQSPLSPMRIVTDTKKVQALIRK